MHSRVTLTFAALAASALALTACTSGSPAPTASPDQSGGVEANNEQNLNAVWSTDTPTVGNVASTPDAVVSYVSPKDGELALSAWSVETGDELWTKKAHPGTGAPGISLTPALFASGGETYVAFPRPAGPGLQSVSVVKVSDGTEVQYQGSDAQLKVKERPSACSGDEAEIPERLCFAASTAGDEAVTEYVLDTSAARVREGDRASEERRSIGADLYSTSDRGPGAERIEYAPDGKTLWSVPYGLVFGPGYSSDNGWNWHLEEEQGLFIGIARTRNSDDRIDTSATTTVGLDLGDGSVRWTARGVKLWCNPAADSEDVGCRYNDAKVEWTDDTGAITEGSVDIVRLDLDTGDVLWEVSTGDWAGTIDSDQAYASNAEASVIVTDGKPALLDFESGETQQIEWDSLPCTEYTSYQFPLWGEPGAELNKYSGGVAVYGCDSARKPVATDAVPAEWVRLAGTELAGDNDAGTKRMIVKTKAGLSLYEVPEE